MELQYFLSENEKKMLDTRPGRMKRLEENEQKIVDIQNKIKSINDKLKIKRGSDGEQILLDKEQIKLCKAMKHELNEKKVELEDEKRNLELQEILSSNEYKFLMVRPNIINKIEEIKKDIQDLNTQKILSEDIKEMNRLNDDIDKLKKTKNDLQNKKKDYDDKIRKKTRRALILVEEIAKRFPEDQLEKIFNINTLKPFLIALTKQKDEDIKSIDFITYNDPFYNERVFGICALMQKIGTWYGYSQISQKYQLMFQKDAEMAHAIFPVRQMGRQIFWKDLEI